MCSLLCIHELYTLRFLIMKKQITLPVLVTALFFALLWGCRKNAINEPQFDPSVSEKGAPALEQLPEPALAYIPDELLVEFVGGEDPQAIASVRGQVKERVRTKTMERFNNPGFSILKVPDVPAAIAGLQRNPRIRWVSPNFVVQTIQSYPNDPYYTNNSLWGMNTIKANTVWPVNKGSRSVFIGLIDEGVMYFHEDLCGQVWDNPFDPEDGVDNDGNGYIDDIHGWDFMHNDKTVFDFNDNHGTHTAGTIGGKGNNAKGVIGVSPNVTIISAKFLEGSGSIANAIKATDYITDLKVRHNLNIPATSNSWGGGGFSQGMYDAIERARLADILFIAAAGNNGTDNDVLPFYPACYSHPNVIAVASTTSTDGISSFSCYGDTTVDLGAPGSGVWSSVMASDNTSSYSSYSGTSMATPHVSGAAALYKAIYPNATYAQVKSALMSSVRPIAALQGKTVSGGVLDVSSFAIAVTDTSAERSCVAPPIDNTPPSKPLNIRTVTATNTSLSVAWDASSDPESGIKYYYAYLRWPSGTTSVVSTTSTQATFSNLGPGINFKVYILARNGFNLWSPTSDTLYAATTGTPDTQAPTLPTDFRATSITSTSISLTWTAATDNVGVSGYTLRWRKAGTTSYSSASFSGTSVTVTNMTTATNYEFNIRAYDASQNYSAYTSPDLKLGTIGADSVRPTPPSNLQVTGTMTNAISLAWDPATDNSAVAGYRVYWRTGTNAYQYATTGTTSYTKSGLSAGVPYDFYVMAYDGGGNLSDSTAPLSATTLSTDATAPSKPLNLRSSNVTSSSISLAWDPSSDPESGISWYWVYLRWPNGNTSSTSTSTASATFNNIGSGLNYRVYVIARNGFSLSSPTSDTLYVTTSGDPDAQAPTLPGNFRSTATGTNSISLAWDAATDNVGVLGYNVRWKALNSTTTYSTNVTSTTYNMSSLLAATNYSISIRSYDASQNFSAWLPDIVVGTTGADQVVPTTPTNVQVTGVTTSSVDLSWTASTDNVGVTGYRVYWRTGANAFQSVTTTGTTYTKTSLASGTAYEFYVVAYDAAGNVSGNSTTVTGTTTVADTQPPTAPTSLTSTGRTANSVSLSWNPSTDNVGVAGYRVYWKTSASATYQNVPVSGTTYTVSGLNTATSYNFYVVAYDAAGWNSSASNVLTTSTLDNQAPTAPSNLQATGSTASSISLSWTGSTDNVGVTGYRVFWKASSSATYQSLNVSGTSTTVTGLTAATSYDFYVAAYDAAGNLSVSSNAISFSTQVAAPTVSATLSGSRTGTTNTLSWNIATNGTLQQVRLEVKVGNGAYTTVYNNTTQPISTAGSYVHTYSGAGKYTYRLFASAGSTSAYSNTIVLTVK
jgi:subtilisin family serine protease